jgi:anti-sigma factor RsiW
MKCKDIERLIIDFKEEELSAEELSAVEEHVERCARCASLRGDLGKIRVYLKRMPRPVLSAELAARTQSMCQVELGSRLLSKAKTNARNHPRSIPKLIWAALFSLTILTSILVLVLLKDFDLKLPLSPQTVVVLTLMVQNAGMLFFAPIMIRKFSSDNKNFRLGSMG